MPRGPAEDLGLLGTVEGAEAYCIIRTVVETARKRGWDILETLAMRPDWLIRKLGMARTRLKATEIPAGVAG